MPDRNWLVACYLRRLVFDGSVSSVYEQLARGQAVWSPASSGRGSVGICSMQSLISLRLCGRLERNPAYRLDQP